MLMAATGFRFLKTSPLCWGRRGYKAPGLAAHHRLNSALCCLAVSPADTQQPEVVLHSLRQREDTGLWEFLCRFSIPANTPWGFEKPQLTRLPKKLGVLFSHLIPLGYNSRSSHAGWAPIMHLGPSHLWPLGVVHGCRPPALSYPHSWIWPLHSHPMVNMSKLQRLQSSGVREKCVSQWKP